MAENHYPTIRDVHECLTDLIGRGLGDLPVQIVVAPDSTMQALAVLGGKYTGKKPALMIEFPGDGARLPVAFISTDRLGGKTGMPSISRQ